MLIAQASGKAFDTIIETDADVMLTVRDISELRKAWLEHPLVRDLGDASLSEYFAPVFDEANDAESETDFKQLLDEFDLDEEELFELFSGQFGLALYNLPGLLLQDADKPDIAIMANFTGSADRLDELMQIQFERNAKAQQEVNPAIEHEMIEENFMGETLYFDEVFDGEDTYIEDGYALVDGVFILARPEERLRSLVESIKAGSEEPIARSRPYQRVREESGAVDLNLYMNLESVMPKLNKALLKQATAGGMAMFGVSGQSLEAALALEALQAISFNCKITEDGIASHSAIVYREKLGFLQLLTYEAGALPAATYVPEDVLASTVARFDLSEMFARLEALLGVASPNTPALINIQLQQVKTNTGVDLRSALLENFGSEIVSFSVMPEGLPDENSFAQAEQVYVFEIKDAAALSGALEALKDLVPGTREQIRTRDFQGETIHTIPGVADPAMPDVPAYDFSYVVTRTHLIVCVGRVGLVQGVLTDMQSQDAGFWQKAETRMLVDQVRHPDVVSRSYTDLEQVVVSLLESIASAGQLSGRGPSLDPSKLPSEMEIPWHLITETYEAEDGIFSEMILLRKEGS
ncbi:hypothetical protein DDZ13_12875 [Coraliomargarita sinensis]|uniref:DUF3352 domain-containing protein n=1 Tax=Coraliomargarita sinensis TaxID=2174842 RepID=A0A317ZDW1_9BACT|nr:hypothetical protein DDZ13_12875 [Coraliomargarita sinensis]